MIIRSTESLLAKLRAGDRLLKTMIGPDEPPAYSLASSGLIVHGGAAKSVIDNGQVVHVADGRPFPGEWFSQTFELRE